MSDNSPQTRLEIEISNLRKHIDIFGKSSEIVSAKSGYKTILLKLKGHDVKLRETIKQAKIARHPDLKGEIVHKLNDLEYESFKKSRSAFETFQKYWNEHDYKTTQGDELNDLVLNFNALANQISKTNTKLWGDWLHSLQETFDVEEYRLNAQRGIASVEDRRDRFKRERENFRVLVSKIPESMSDITKIKDVAEVLSGLLGLMDHNEPEDVKAFFDALDNPPYGAVIGLLTPGVIRYLEDQGGLGEYLVRRRGTHVGQ
ncbi:hypothetical protein N8265_06005 [Oceanospirillaceae bacterium]|nr:hypothetical protein [Oceanospirillaceae bacterium]